ncbi:hypothetical protein MKW98_005393 [Papaver atlanticum]|uniref:Uncharacterized protein n=1 Tax=Papaver atlanticum TaxID=357466 RepID=A0AAD4RXU3_9MAGN|nr:hypothetical protein MKW98_005393 [Papaver atlanticum]
MNALPIIYSFIWRTRVYISTVEVLIGFGWLEWELTYTIYQYVFLSRAQVQFSSHHVIYVIFQYHSYLSISHASVDQETPENGLIQESNDNGQVILVKNMHILNKMAEKWRQSFLQARCTIRKKEVCKAELHPPLYLKKRV